MKKLLTLCLIGLSLHSTPTHAMIRKKFSELLNQINPPKRPAIPRNNVPLDRIGNQEGDIQHTYGTFNSLLATDIEEGQDPTKNRDLINLGSLLQKHDGLPFEERVSLKIETYWKERNFGLFFTSLDV